MNKNESGEIRTTDAQIYTNAVYKLFHSLPQKNFGLTRSFEFDEGKKRASITINNVGLEVTSPKHTAVTVTNGNTTEQIRHFGTEVTFLIAKGPGSGNVSLITTNRPGYFIEGFHFEILPLNIAKTFVDMLSRQAGTETPTPQKS